MRRRLLILLASIVLVTMPAPGIAADGAWLDQDPPVQWNRPRMAVPTIAAQDQEIFSQILDRCSETARSPETAEDQVIADAGWFLMGGYASGWGVRVVGGNGTYDGMCRPLDYQYFVFVDGSFAGTLSPTLMRSRTDGAGRSPTVPGVGRVYVEYDRYAPGDPFCCPSGQSGASFQIERTDTGPVALLSFTFHARVIQR
jgi:hypothetical protein